MVFPCNGVFESVSYRHLLFASTVCSTVLLSSLLPLAGAFAQGGPVDLAAVAPELAVNQTPMAVVQPSPVQPNLVIRVGDQIKLAFYELLDSDESKWRGPSGRSVSSPIGFYQRAELTGSYTVQEDGTISLPLLGSFMVDGSDTITLVDRVTKPFGALVGRKGFVNVLAVERQPIYIVGPVKNPGSFKYQPNLTALHAVALAGGLRRSESEAWQNVESRREVAALEKSLEKVKRLVARTSVLKAERDGGQPAVKEVVSLTGQQDGSLLIDQESSQRRLTEIGRAVQYTALRAAVSNSRAELQSRSGRLSPYENNIRLRAERLKALEQLSSKNLITRAPVVQAQSELSDVEDRRQQAQIEVDVSRQKVQQAEQDLSRYNVETQLEIEKAIAMAERDSLEAVVDTEGSLNIIRSLSASQGQADDGRFIYEIVRHDRQGTQLISVSETTVLEPGDLLRVKPGEKN